MYVIASISFSFLICTLFSRANVAAGAAGVLWFLNYSPYFFLQVRLWNLDKPFVVAGIICSGRWQAPVAVLPPEGPEDKGHGHSRAREWPKHASPRARRARGRAKLSARFGACQCYYMFFTIQPKIAIFMAQFKYLNDGQNA